MQIILVETLGKKDSDYSIKLDLQYQAKEVYGKKQSKKISIVLEGRLCGKKVS